jgi:hypothetical protein
MYVTPVGQGQELHVPHAQVGSTRWPERRMKLRYGVNQADECWDFALGPQRERIWARLRAIDTRMVRLFVFDKQAPDPVREWRKFASYIQAVLEIGAIPMMTFGKLQRPFDDPRAIRWFANQCADVVWNCIEEWGGETVRNWYWCVLNEPNNGWISGGLTFEQYRCIYEQVAEGACRWLTPYLDGRKPLVGGPAVEGFPAFWWDWPWRFVHEIDNALIGFVDWHRYADWRNYGENGAPQDQREYRALMMSQSLDYEFRARAISELVAGRNMLNICGELNTHSHYTAAVREHFNYSVFAAAFYISSLLHLMRGEADIEMFWTGTEESGGYGMMNNAGDTKPAYQAKKLCTQYIRPGDLIWFPQSQHERAGVDVVATRADDGRISALFVHLKDDSATYTLAAFDDSLTACGTLFKIDEGSGNQVVETACDGTVRFNGYGVAIVTNRVAVMNEIGRLVGHESL